MTEEEKKAIEFLETYIKNDKEDIKILNNTIDEDIDYYTEVEPIQKRVKYLETIKNLIEKLQKEIEEKTTIILVGAEKVKSLEKENEELRKNQRYKKDNIFSLEYDKETLRDMVLEKQEEIKELKSNSIPKDKIREKIEPKLNKLKEEMNKEFDMYGKSSEYLNLDEQYNFLYEIKELLEEG